MKSIRFKAIFIMTVMVSILSSCTKDSDVQVTAPQTVLFAESFDNSDLTATGWITYAQTGTKQWSESSYSGNGYASFSSYGSGQPTNVAWLISPEFNMDKQDGEKLFFQSCTDGYVHSIDNSLELYVSTNFDGVNFNNADWQKIAFTAPTPDSTRYVYINSGIIDLSSYTGLLRFAFKVKGTSALSGGYQVDNVRLFY